MPQGDEFNASILGAVAKLYEQWGGRGYNIKSYFTHDLQYGPDCCIKANNPPLTMCVAAAAEVIVAALTTWYERTGDKRPFQALPIQSWRGGTKKDIRPHIFMYDDVASNGTAHALERFGIGRQVPFSALNPGGFINFNRASGTGHACVFLSYIDASGNDVGTYGPTVAGFRYFSAQGSGPPEGGFGYRWAFFGDHCPTLPAGKKRDCGVIRSDKPSLLCCGHMLAPEYWPPHTGITERITTSIKRESTGVSEPELAQELTRELAVPDLSRFDGITTD